MSAHPSAFPDASTTEKMEEEQPPSRVEAAVAQPPSRPNPKSPLQMSSASGAVAGSSRRPAKRDQNNVQPLYMQSAGNLVLVRRRKRKDESPLKLFMRWFVENQIGLTFNIIALILLTHAVVPKARAYTSKFFTLGYYNPRTGLYGVGSDDAFLVLFCIVLLTGLRAATMEHMLAPFAKTHGILKRKTIARFCEQGWVLVYCSVFWTTGIYLWASSPYYMNLGELWTDWPTREVSGLMKAYFLGQFSFWIQQILVINMEERRKDHWQMFTHHLLTSTLMYASYRFHFTRVGNLILVLMDVCDLLLAIAKCLKYMGYSTACDIMFGAFMLAWLVGREIFYPMACWSVYRQSVATIGNVYFEGTADNLTGPFPIPANITRAQVMEPLWKSDGKVFYSDSVMRWFLSMLLSLQVMIVVWFAMIVNVAVKVLRGDGAEDSRSDDEGDDEDEEEYVYEAARLLEQEVGVEALDLKNWERRTGVRKPTAHTSSVSIPGHSDRKELLGRIGCEKQVD